MQRLGIITCYPYSCRIRHQDFPQTRKPPLRVSYATRTSMWANPPAPEKEGKPGFLLPYLALL